MRSYAVGCFFLLACVSAFAHAQITDGKLIEAVCSRPENQELCHGLMAAAVKEIRRYRADEGEEPVVEESAMEMEKRKPSFVRFGKRGVVEKRKPSFVRFGRK